MSTAKTSRATSQPRRKPGPGRPKREKPPRRTMNLRIDIQNIDWMNENLPRTIYVSDFANDAIREKIARHKSRS